MSIESVMPSNHLILCHPLSSRPQSSPASGSSPVSQLFASGGQSIGASASDSSDLSSDEARVLVRVWRCEGPAPCTVWAYLCVCAHVHTRCPQWARRCCGYTFRYILIKKKSISLGYIYRGKLQAAFWVSLFLKGTKHLSQRLRSACVGKNRAGLLWGSY